MSLQFIQGKNTSGIKLRRVEVANQNDEVVFTRSLLASGRYSLKLAPKITRQFRKAIETSMPSHFMFSPLQEFFSLGFSDYRKKKAKGIKARHPIGQTRGNGEYIGLVGYAERMIEELLESHSYLGPLREHPKRLFKKTDEIPESVGTRGENTPDILCLRKDRKFQASIRKWIREFSLAREIYADPLGHGAFTLRVRGKNKRADTDYADVGFGLSQVLPLIVQGIHAEPGSVICVEQPEIHLNPRLQSTLANFFAEIAKLRKFAIIETHSEHFLLRLRSLIAKGILRPGDVALYYVEKLGDRSVQRRIRIERDGHIDPNEWPKGFFEESVSESLRLASFQTV